MSKIPDFVSIGFQPFTRIELLTYAARWAKGTKREFFPFSCRVRTKGEVEWVTVVDLIMPDKHDLHGEPVLRTMGAIKYADLLEENALRASFVSVARSTYESRIAELDSMNLHELLIASQASYEPCEAPTIEDEFRTALRAQIDTLNLNRLIQLASFVENFATSSEEISHNDLQFS